MWHSDYLDLYRYVVHFTEWDSKLTFYWWEYSVSKETVPLFPLMGLPAPLWHYSSPVPDRAGKKSTWCLYQRPDDLISWLKNYYYHLTKSWLKTFYNNTHWVPYLMPLLMVSVGAQLTVSTQSVQWYCLLSRNQPESDRPRTCIPVCPSPSSSSATRSTFSRTPVPPALHTEIWYFHTGTYTGIGMKCRGFWIPILTCEHTCFLLIGGPWRCPDLCSAGPSQLPE